jgi:hypothetical protein
MRCSLARANGTDTAHCRLAWRTILTLNWTLTGQTILTGQRHTNPFYGFGFWRGGFGSTRRVTHFRLRRRYGLLVAVRGCLGRSDGQSKPIRFSTS